MALEMLQSRKKGGRARLRLGTYPYTYARVSAMRGKLIKQNEYIRLLKSDTSSIIKFLEETEYKASIDKLSPKYSGVELAERALADNMVRTAAKLREISKPEVVSLIDAYLKRWDIYNIKTILRGKLKQLRAEELLMPLGSIPEVELKELMNLPTASDILKQLKARGYAVDVAQFEKTKNLALIENQLDKDFYHMTLRFAEQIPEEGKQFNRFLKMEIDIVNMRNLLKLKRMQAGQEQAMQYLISAGLHINGQQLRKLAAARNAEELIEQLRGTKYNALFEKNAAPVDIELALDKYWLQQAQLYSHQKPLSVQTILAYLLAKDIEVRNLRALVRGKQLGLQETFIEQKLLI